MKKYSSLFFIVFSILIFSQEGSVEPDFIKEIHKEVPNLIIADSLFNRYREKKEGKPFGYYKEYSKEKGFIDAWHSEFHHWRKENEIYVDAKGYIVIPEITDKEFDQTENRIKQKKRIDRDIKKRQRKSSSRSNRSAQNDVLAAAAVSSFTSSPDWTYLGPKDTYGLSKGKIDLQANAYSVDQAHNNRDIVFCSIEGAGIFKSVDRGETWSETTMNIKLSGTIEKLKIHPENDSIVVGINQNQIISSLNGGQDWRQVTIPSNLASPTGYSIYNRSDLDIVYDKSTAGLDDDFAIVVGKIGNYKFNIIDNTIEIFNAHNLPSSDVKVHPNDSSVIYILSFDETTYTEKIYKSTDRGNTFTLKDGNGWITPPTGVEKINLSRGGRIGLTPADDNVIYVHMIGEYTSGNDMGFLGIYKSTDGGDNWQLMDVKGPGAYGGAYVYGSSNLSFTNYVEHVNVVSNVNASYHQGFYDSGIVVDAKDPNQIIVGGVGIFKSIDSGKSFKMLSNGYVYSNGPVDKIHSDIQSCFSRINELGEVETWISTDGGIVLSKDFFEDITASERKTTGLPCDFWGFDVGLINKSIAGGRYHNGSIGSLGDYNGNFLYVGGGESATGGILIQNQERDMIWDDAGNRTLDTTIIGSHSSLSGISIYPNANSSNALGGMAKTLSGTYYYANKSDNKELYKVYINETGGYGQLLLQTFSTNIRYVGTCATNENYIYATITDSGGRARELYKTEDGGVSWNKVYDFNDVGATDHVHIEVDNDDPNKVWAYVYKKGNLYYSEDGGNTFVEKTVMPNNRIDHLVYQWSSNNLYAMTRGNPQIYRYDIENDSWHEMGSRLSENIDNFRLGVNYGEKKLILSASGHGVWEIDLYSESNINPVFASLNSDIIVGYDKADIFSVIAETYGDVSGKTVSWGSNSSKASVTVAADKQSATVTFNDFGIYDIIYKLTDNTTGVVQTIVKKFYVYPGCSFDEEENQILIPMDNMALWFSGDDLYQSYTLQGGANRVYDKYGYGHFISGYCAPITFNKYNNTEHRSVYFDGSYDCRMNFDGNGTYTEGKTFFWVLNEDEGAGTQIRNLLGDDTGTDFHAGYPSNRRILQSAAKFDLTKMNGSIIDATTTDRPTTPSVIGFRVNETDSVVFSNFSKDRTFTSRLWKGDLAELIIYNRRLTDAEFQKVEQYLIKKYDITTP